MQILWGMINTLQVITHFSLLDISLTPLIEDFSKLLIETSSM
jgi:hypothetical protein